MTNSTGRRYEMVNIDDLHPYERNARTHSAEQVQRIADSIKEFGFVNPVLIDGNGMIIAGHGRVLAAKQLGMTEVPCIYVEDLTDEQKRAYILADNKLAEQAGWDEELLRTELDALNDSGFDISLAGFSMDDIVIPDITPTLDTPDELPETPDTPRTKAGDAYALGDHRLICGDSTDPDVLKKLMDGEQADLLLTDPPYGVDYENNPKVTGDGLGYDGILARGTSHIENDDPRTDIGAFLSAFVQSTNSILKSGGAFYIFHPPGELAPAFMDSVRGIGWHMQCDLVWVKNRMVISRFDYQPKHEPIIYGWKDGAAHYFIDDRTQTAVFDSRIDIDNADADTLRKYIRMYMSQPSTVIDYARPSVSNLHPTMKPTGLLEILIKNSSRPGEIVLDTFGGSGSTLIACEHLGRKCRMAELDPHYCDVIVKRWEDETGKKAELCQ